MIEALIFDFDGTILDTETPEYEAWVSVYTQYDSDFPLAKYLNSVGGGEFFDFGEYLKQQSGKKVITEGIKKEHALIFKDLLLKENLMPGVLNLIYKARKKGIKIAIASNSNKSWVNSHTERLGIKKYFDCIKCSDDVQRIKPYPDLFLSVLQELQVSNKKSVVLEDSQNGIDSALAAHIPCIAIPNKLTKNIELNNYTLKINSLEEVNIEKLNNLIGQYCIS